METFPHLKHAPIVEAVLLFQADASAAWDGLGQKIRDELTEHFPDFSEIQEQRLFEGRLSVNPGEEPSAKSSLSPAFAFILHKADRSAAIQVRRDGFAYSQLKPYASWGTFLSEALRYWEIYGKWMAISSPHNISLRFINILSYPAEGFRLEEYFRNAPKNLEGTKWEFAVFREHYEYVTRDHRFRIGSIFSRQHDSPSDANHHFVLDLTVSPLNPLSEHQDSIGDLLTEMRNLKNQAFFSKLTETGLQPYL